MIRMARRLVCCFLILLVIPLAAAAQDQDPAAIIQKFGGKASFDDVEATVKELAATGDPKVARALNALSEGDLVYAKSNNQVFIGKGRGTIELFDPITGEKVAEGASSNYAKVRVKNSIRRAVTDALGTLTLRSPDPAKRMAAANTMFSNATPEQIDVLDQAIAAETAPSIKARLEQARAAAVLKSDRPATEKSEAVKTLSAKADRETLLDGARACRRDQGSGDAQGRRSRSALDREYDRDVGRPAERLVRAFARLGPAARRHRPCHHLRRDGRHQHGAWRDGHARRLYDLLRPGDDPQQLPGLFGWSLAIALPLAFLVSAVVGLIMERGIIRFLYGRPLETLLATFGVSLILQQAVRTIFGPSNRQVGNPDWMSGAFDIGLMSVTWNRMWIIVFALIVFAALLLVLNRTPLGLQMRAVTQNRKMASAMGIRTPWVDAMTFALGSGIAGIAGVALSQIDNVSPNLGQGYIIDSFMVVVFGGVGNLWGTLVGAMTLGVVNKFLEPYAGAVLGKIVVLVLIILFIQKRPRGLFAQKGRFVDA